MSFAYDLLYIRMDYYLIIQYYCDLVRIDSVYGGLNFAAESLSGPLFKKCGALIVKFQLYLVISAIWGYLCTAHIAPVYYETSIGKHKPELGGPAMASMASWASSAPGISTLILLLPSIVTDDSATPIWFTLLSMTALV